MGFTQGLKSVLKTHNSMGVLPDFYLRDVRLPGIHLVCFHIDSPDIMITIRLEVPMSYNPGIFPSIKSAFIIMYPIECGNVYQDRMFFPLT